jgi:prepilin-type N-terminal cleavage/methylation domain-containing protein
MKTRPLLTSRAQRNAFSLIEMLVAMGVLSLMMVFLFNLVGQTLRAWEGGSKQVEAAQAARIGLETMAQDLQFALGGSAVSVVGNTTKTNIVPFFSTNNATAKLGLPAALDLAPSSGQIFAVTPSGSASDTNALYEIGYVSLYVSSANGYASMRGRRYQLVRHAARGGMASAFGRGDFFYANSLPNQTAAGEWLSEEARAFDANQGIRVPFIPNCYQIQFQYASNNNGVLTFTDTWTAGDRLPAGVLVTAKVMDEKTAARVALLRPNGLSTSDVDENAGSDVARILREGTVEVIRFIPFVNARP